ncbi:LysR substrate-binding domain-containing protein [Sediminicoccus sp. KRV36]|uniref:LysR substrate-binding domain-containing protein n=1 Tax=Sediminicoccus sp. KRV36 TaxID=3133721 RepID=UPI00200C9237|nr:LysR substrate-binding domain-containing protein [Sediminicoccus rosea]UPY34918.1 LysR family transcriptional regulator [Sediminicoccus rosea]
MRRHLDRRLKLQWLRVIDAIEAQGSLLRASAMLGLGQPALTRALQEAEQVIGASLFTRHARGVRPTEAGLVITRLARRVLAELHRAEEALDHLAGAQLAIGVLPVAAVGVLPGALIQLKQARPEIQLRLQQGRMEELLPLLATGEIDLVVGRLYPPATPDGFLREALWEEPISFLARAGHPLFNQPVTPVALKGCELILPTVSQRVGQEIDERLAALGLTAQAPLRSSSYGFIREMLLASDMVSVMPRLMMVGDLLRGTLGVLPLDQAAPPRPAGLILPGDRPLPEAGLAFVAALRAHLGEIAAQGLSVMPDENSLRRKIHKTARTRSR